MSKTFSPAKKNVIIISGPTASGKSDLAFQLAGHYHSEIFSADSRQIYKEMTIGTAKPDIETLHAIKHHFIDHISIHEEYSVGKYIKQLNEALESYFENHQTAIIAGGTGLYLNAFVNGLDDLPSSPEVLAGIQQTYKEEGLAALVVQLKHLDPAYYDVVDRNNPHRIIRALAVTLSEKTPYSSLLGAKKHAFPYHMIGISLTPDRGILYQKINGRVEEMLRQGLEEEARNLMIYRDKKALQTVGYQELFRYFDGEITKAFAIEEIKKNSRRYAKRQVTWFKKYHTGSFFNEWTKESIISYIDGQLTQ